MIDVGEKSIYPKILKEIKLRDKKDKQRKHSPLVIPKGAHIIDNNGSFRKTVKNITELLEKIKMSQQTSTKISNSEYDTLINNSLKNSSVKEKVSQLVK